jgi:uncharacterized protein YqgC (DUF456 family)
VEILQAIGHWTWYLVWSALLLAASLLVYVGLGGTLVILGLATLHAVITGFDPIGWRLLAILLGLLLLGEAIDFILSNFYAVGRGASAPGAVGAYIGGFAGALALAGLLPIIGAVIGSFLGAFAGGVLGEWWRQRRVEPSLRIGTHAFFGRVLAMLAKHAVGLVMVFLILRATFPGA